MRFNVICICCKKKYFILDMTSIGDICMNCFDELNKLNEIDDKIVKFYVKNKDAFRETTKYWNVPKDKRLI